MNSLCHKRWVSALDECDAHILRIQNAIDHLAQKLPLTKDAYDFLSDSDIAYIDQIVFGFSKLSRYDWKQDFSIRACSPRRGY